MDILLETSGSKNSIDEMLYSCEKVLKNFTPIARKEFGFETDGVTGKLRTYYPFPGRKGLEILFGNAAEHQMKQIEEITNDLFGKTEYASVVVNVRKPVNNSHLTNILSQQFINALHLNLKDNVGISIKSGNKKLEITNGLRGHHSVAVRNRCEFNEKSIFQMNEEAKRTIDEILALQTGIIIAEKSKKFPQRLKREDFSWWNVGGTKTNIMPCFMEKNDMKYYISEASAGFKTFKSNLSNLFSGVFLNTAWGMSRIDMLTLEKYTGKKRCRVSVGKDNDTAYEGLTSSSVTIENILGTKRIFNPATEPEVIRLLNTIYGTVMFGINLEEAFSEYVLNFANETCICGKKFKNTLHKEIVEIGCHSEKKHLMHRSCWNKWIKKHKPKEYDWMQGVCPFCGNDASVYNAPWNNRKLVWKSIG